MFAQVTGPRIDPNQIGGEAPNHSAQRKTQKMQNRKPWKRKHKDANKRTTQNCVMTNLMINYVFYIIFAFFCVLWGHRHQISYRFFTGGVDFNEIAWFSPNVYILMIFAEGVFSRIRNRHISRYWGPQALVLAPMERGESALSIRPVFIEIGHQKLDIWRNWHN